MRKGWDNRKKYVWPPKEVMENLYTQYGGIGIAAVLRQPHVLACRELRRLGITSNPVHKRPQKVILDIAKLQELLDTNSREDVANTLGISSKTLLDRINTLGLVTKWKYDFSAKRGPRFDAEKLKGLAPTHTANEVAATMGICIETVRIYLRKLGIECVPSTTTGKLAKLKLGEATTVGVGSSAIDYASKKHDRAYAYKLLPDGKYLVWVKPCSIKA